MLNCMVAKILSRSRFGSEKRSPLKNIHPYGDWTFSIEEDSEANFFIEEVECIVDVDEEIEESDASLSILLGGSA